MLRRSLLGLLVLWAAAALLVEARGALTTFDARAGWQQPAQGWRFGSPQVAQLEACLAPARQRIPQGSIVAFAGPDEPRGNAFFLTRWVAYLMPNHEVLAREDPAAGIVAGYVIAYDVPLQDPRLERQAQLPGCDLYRVIHP